MAGEADGLVVDALHQAAVAGERPGTMIDQIVAEYGAEVPLRNGHADRHREALSQRSRRRLDTRQHEIFGMSGAGRIEPPEVEDVLHRRLLVDRKSVGWGKSGSGRVNLGGGLFIKKKNKTTH